MLLTNAVDDELIAANNYELRLKFLEFLRKRFDIEDMGMAHWYLQGRLTQNEDYCLINQGMWHSLHQDFFHNITTQMLPKKTRLNMNHHYQLHLSLQRKSVLPICLKFNSWNKLMVFSIPQLLEC